MNFLRRADVFISSSTTGILLIRTNPEKYTQVKGILVNLEKDYGLVLACKSERVAFMNKILDKMIESSGINVPSHGRNPKIFVLDGVEVEENCEFLVGAQRMGCSTPEHEKALADEIADKLRAFGFEVSVLCSSS
jgi:hypothetical protein